MECLYEVVRRAISSIEYAMLHSSDMTAWDALAALQRDLVAVYASFDGGADVLRSAHGLPKSKAAKELTYLASPYSDTDQSVRRARWEWACFAAAKIMQDGKLVFSPIAHSHPISTSDLRVQTDFATWEQFCRRTLVMCDSVTVLRLDGWERSVGVKAEIAMAKALGKPVTYLDVADVSIDGKGEDR